MRRGLLVWGYEVEVEDLLDDAQDDLTPDEYQNLLNAIAQVIEERKG